MEMVLKVTLKMLSSFWAILGSFWGHFGALWVPFGASLWLQTQNSFAANLILGPKNGPKWFLNGPEMTKNDLSV